MLVSLLSLAVLGFQPKLLMSANLKESIEYVRFSPDGRKLIAVTPSTGKAVLFDVKSGKVLAQAKVPGRGDGASYSFDRKVLVTSQRTSRDARLVRTIQVTSFPGGGLAKMVDANGWPIFPNLGNRFLLAHDKGATDLMSMDTLTKVSGFPTPVLAIGIDKGERAAAVFTGSSIAVLSWPDGKVRMSVNWPSQRLPVGIALDDRTHTLVVVGSDRFDVLDSATGKNRVTADEVYPTEAVRISPDGKTAWVGNVYGRAHLVDLRTGKILFSGLSSELGSMYMTHGVDISADNRFVAAGFYTGEVKVWDVSSITRK